MKKLTTILVLVAMLLTTLGITVAAESYMDKTPATCEFSFDVKKADPSAVKKDGIIDLDGGEYVKVDVPFSELSVNFRNSADYLPADAMARTIEYYFSWDETHGFNIAVKYLAKGNVEGTEYDGFFTNIDNGAGSSDPAVPQDNFMSNIGLNFASGEHKEIQGWSLLYYAIGKKFDGTYLGGHWNQLGNSGNYAPVGGVDYEVAYPNMDGTVIIEWSIPFAEFIDVVPDEGVSFGFALSAAAGTNDWSVTNSVENCWAVSLGQNGGWLTQVSGDNGQATATLSNEPVKESAVVDTTAPDTTAAGDTTTAATTPAPTKPSTTAIVTEVVTSQVAVTDEEGKEVTDADGGVVTEVVTEVITSIVTDAPEKPSSPVTGDPMVIAAVVVAISACGIVVAKKRK